MFRTIDGGEEMYLLSALGCYDLLHEPCLVIDMGGGSTEIGFVEQHLTSVKANDWVSLPYGLLSFNTKSAYPLMDITSFTKICFCST